MSCDYCVVFAHHFCSEIVLHHFYTLQIHNPGMMIIPVASNDDCLPGSFIVSRFCDADTTKYLSSPLGGDYLLVQFFKHYRLRCKRYILLEWDCLVQDDLREYFCPFDAPVVAASYFTDLDLWPWKHHKKFLPDYLQENLAGIAPMNCTAWHYEVLERIATIYPANAAISEIRMGSVLRYLNIPVDTTGHYYRGQNDWRPITSQQTNIGVWHSKKN